MLVSSDGLRTALRGLLIDTPLPPGLLESWRPGEIKNKILGCNHLVAKS